MQPTVQLVLYTPLVLLPSISKRLVLYKGTCLAIIGGAIQLSVNTQQESNAVMGTAAVTTKNANSRQFCP